MIRYIHQSSNRHLGPIPATYSSRDTCPPCALAGFCYAEGFPVRLHWDRVPEFAITPDQLCKHIRRLSRGQVWRHCVAGDTELDWLPQLVHANAGRPVIAFTHHKPGGDTLELLRDAVRGGFNFNLSAEDSTQADQLAETGLQVATLIPNDTPNVSYTPAGRKIVACPTDTKNLNCSRCGLCSRSDRNVIIGFRPKAHKRALIEMAARGPLEQTIGANQNG